MKKIFGIPLVLNDTDFLCASFKEGHEEAFCIYKGNPDLYSSYEVLVRIHSGCITSEVFKFDTCDCKWQLDRSIELISSSVSGILIYLPGQEGKGNGLFNKIKSFKLMNVGLNLRDAYESMNLPSDARNYDFAVQILKEFGVEKMRLITNSPNKIMSCIDGGIIISERISIVMEKPNPTVKQLLESKRLKFNHYINLDEQLRG